MPHGIEVCGDCAELDEVLNVIAHMNEVVPVADEKISEFSKVPSTMVPTLTVDVVMRERSM